MVRPRRLAIPGLWFHVTFRGNNRQEIFETDFDKSDYLRRLAEIFPAYRVRMIAYCIMINHGHLLVRNMLSRGLSSAMQRLQGGYAKSWNRRYNRTGTIFERRFHAEPVEDDSHLLNAALYIHANPPDPMVYRWSSLGAYLGGKCDIPICVDEVLDLAGGRKYFAELFEDYLSSKSVEPRSDQSLVRGLSVVGTDAFKTMIEPEVTRRAERRRRASRPEGLSIEGILNRVMTSFGVTPKEIRSRSRVHRVATARAIFCALAIREGIAPVVLARELNRTIPGIAKIAESGRAFASELDGNQPGVSA